MIVRENGEEGSHVGGRIVKRWPFSNNVLFGGWAITDRKDYWRNILAAFISKDRQISIRGLAVCPMKRHD